MTQKTGKDLYEEYTDNHPTIHSNRFAAWSELGKSDRNHWNSLAELLKPPAEKDLESIHQKVLDQKFYCDDLGRDASVAEYMAILLTTVFQEGESFSGKRAFGNSGWENDLVLPFVMAGAIKGRVVDPDGEPEAKGWNQQEFDKMLEQVIRFAFNLPPRWPADD